MHAKAVMYTPNDPPWQQEAQIVRRNLKPLGIDVEVKEFPGADFSTRIGRLGEPFDLAISGWYFGSTDPVQMIGIFDGRAIRATGYNNPSSFNDPAVNRKIAAVTRLSGAERYRAAGRLAFQLARDEVPAAAIATTASRDFFSARTGCHVYQPVFGMDIAALCLRG